MTRLIVSTALLLGFAASLPAGTVVNFDDLTGIDVVPEGYGGIEWGGNWNYFDFEQFPYTATSGAVRVFTNDVGEGEVSFSFDTPQVFDGAWFAGVFSTSVHFDLYEGDTLVYTSDALSLWQDPAFLASGYTGLVSRVGVWTNANGYYAMDDVSYHGADGTGGGPGGGGAVPEPGTMALMGAGLAACGVWRGRRKLFD